MTDRIQFRTAVTVYRCLRKSVPGYLANLCIPLSDRSSRYHLRFTAGRQLVVPPAKLSTYGHQAFTVSGPRIWNSLPDYLKDSELSIDIFKRYLKPIFSLAINYSTLSCIRDFVTVCYTNLLLRLRLAPDPNLYFHSILCFFCGENYVLKHVFFR